MYYSFYAPTHEASSKIYRNKIINNGMLAEFHMYVQHSECFNKPGNPPTWIVIYIFFQDWEYLKLYADHLAAPHTKIMHIALWRNFEHVFKSLMIWSSQNNWWLSLYITKQCIQHVLIPFITEQTPIWSTHISMYLIYVIVYVNWE